MTNDASMDIDCPHPTNALVWDEQHGLCCKACGAAQIDDVDTLQRWGATQVRQPLVLELATVNDAIDEEHQHWQREQISPMNVSSNLLQMDAQFFALLNYLNKVMPSFNVLEFELEWKQMYLMRAIELRQNIIRDRTTQQVLQGITGPDGKPINVK